MAKLNGLLIILLICKWDVALGENRSLCCVVLWSGQPSSWTRCPSLCLKLLLVPYIVAQAGKVLARLCRCAVCQCDHYPFHMDWLKWTASWQNQQMTCAQQRLWSAWASVWSESSLCAQWVAKDPSFLHVDSEDSWSDWVDAQTDLGLSWAHMSLCWFCHDVAQI